MKTWQKMGLVTLAVIGIAAAGTQRTPLNRAFLQSHLDANNFNVTNLQGGVPGSIVAYTPDNGLMPTNVVSVSNVIVINLYSFTNFMDNLTITNGLTNLSLTPNTVLKADGGQQIASIPNGTGALTNDGAGNFGWTAVVGSSGPWTNNSDFIWPVGEPAPDATGANSGPGFFFRYDGSLYVGTNVTQDTSVSVSDNTQQSLYVFSMADSNQPPTITIGSTASDNTNYTTYGQAILQTHFDPASPDSRLALESAYSAGNYDDKFIVDINPAQTFGQLTTNNVAVFRFDSDGLVTANGYVDKSGNVGDLVAYGASGRLVSTNVLNLLTNVATGAQVLTNDGTYVHLVGTVTNINSPWELANDGELLIGTNVFLGGLAPGFHVFGAVSMTDSNQPAFQFFDMVVTDDVLRKNYGIISGASTGSSASWSLFSGTDGASTNTVVIASQTGHAPFTFTVDATNRAILPYTGIWDSQGYVDESGIDGQFVSYASGKRLTPTLNGGALTNVNNVSTGLSNYITSVTNGLTPLPANAAGALTNSGAGVLGWYGSYATQPSANAFAGSNYFGGAVTTSTNSCNGIPDMTQLETLFSTNNTPVFGKPTGVDTTGKSSQWLLIHITNTLASAKAITSDSTWSVVGTPWVTNWTDLWLNIYAASKSNAFYIPVN